MNVEYFKAILFIHFYGVQIKILSTKVAGKFITVYCKVQKLRKEPLIFRIFIAKIHTKIQ